MTEIILHNYPQSPVAEKVRLGLGLKQLSWKNVLIPRIPPKPDLVALTGGYRRTPVMQIGADIYCDSQCILRELERRFPEPSYFPNNSEGLAWGMSRWGEQVFVESIKLVLGAAGEALPEDFARDRGRLYFGPDWQNNLNQFHHKLAPIISQIRSHLDWVEQSLASTGNKFLFTDQPGLADLEIYYFVWFIRGRWESGPEFLSQFPCIQEWEQNVAAIGHGDSSDLSSQQALEISKAATTQTEIQIDQNDPQGLASGMQVSIKPAVDGGEEATVGCVHTVDAKTISILREHELVGEVCVHFPRVGYQVDFV